MIRCDVEQGSAGWLKLRLGIPTASCFDQIITNKTMKPSSSADAYAYRLIAEQILGCPLDGASSGFMERGTILEESAVDFYELQRGCDTEKVGFVLRDDRRVGCSPDRLVGGDGLLEIKCPSAAVHIGYLLGDEGIGYRAQTQGQLWLTGRAWVDTLSYNPGLPSALNRVERDEPFIAALDAAMTTFLAFMDDKKAELQQRFGLFAGAEFPVLHLVPPLGSETSAQLADRIGRRGAGAA